MIGYQIHWIANSFFHVWKLVSLVLVHAQETQFSVPKLDTAQTLSLFQDGAYDKELKDFSISKTICFSARTIGKINWKTQMTTPTMMVEKFYECDLLSVIMKSINLLNMTSKSAI